MEEPINTIKDGYLKRNFITIPTASATLSLTESMKRSLEVYEARKKKLESYAKNPKADKAYIRECDLHLQADAYLYNYALQLIDRLEVVEERVSVEFDSINTRFIQEIEENKKLITENIALRKQLRINATH